MNPISLTMAPLKIVDIAGSALMIIFAFLCLHDALALKRKDPRNVIWIYLLWLVSGLFIFVISRAASHLLKYTLISMGHFSGWDHVRQVTGSINTIVFVIVGAITLFFQRVYHIYRQMAEDRDNIWRGNKEITMRKTMERQLRQADKLASLGQLSAGVAHEINNPLGLILGYTQLILKEVEDKGQLHEDLKVIERHTMNCKKIVEDLLKFSRAMDTTKTPANLNELLSEVLSVVEANFEKDKVYIVKQLAGELPPHTADPDKMRQVFMNLFMNAYQAIEGPGTITVSTSITPDGQHIVISFADTGSGIPNDIIHKIFDPFFTTKPIGMGTGLGLSVSYGIIKDHDGDIRVESSPGIGSIFRAYLPIDKVPTE